MALNKTGSLIGIIAIIIIVAVGAFVYFGFGDDEEETDEDDENGEDIIIGGSESVTNTNSSSSILASDGAAPRAFVITITDNRYSPQSLTINTGDTVTWKNNDSDPNWPASAMHPTHRVYPGSDIEKCGTSEQDMIFDACGGLETGEEWSFTFNVAGSWSYHDHLNAQKRGTIVVQ